MQDFYLIRHGETDWNVKFGKLQGHTDIPLNEKGIWQAQQLAKLSSSLGFDKVISSDLSRALTTAQHLTDFQGPQFITKELREVQLGMGEGLTWDEITEKLGPEFRSRWSSNGSENMDLRFPGGESRREVIQRVSDCLLSFLHQHSGETLAFVTHGFVIRSMIFHHSQLQNHFIVPNCAVVPFSLQDGKILYKGPEQPDQLLYPRMDA